MDYKGGNIAFITKYNQKRVDKSRSSPTQWRNVDGKRNQADVAYREIPKTHEFLNSSTWLDGPEFLALDPSEWPKEKEEEPIPFLSGDGDNPKEGSPYVFQGTDWRSSYLLAK
jgi:hypothetical protein